ncbi:MULTISPECIES: glycosyltransferase family 2 protein [Bacteroides]|uniref:glycosyltransferase family 2 protein n=1 Tax=Bacteroides TaxID=816 RepID=UPI000E444850|nr:MULTISPECIES: glycosyltransferase family 2 protein [Bacteroides]MBS7575671.1 glycosyltransferase family 2 protein [Bacteroides propionicigenes]RGM25596.1 glycosyltransferase family 2 protein [Bacteroides sp. OM08-17BH]HBO06975.1 family 2 glycosyl transferase [Bacteroides sp.]
MEDYGLVSIITPTWNCAVFICETIKSIEAQTYTNWELLIQDDCSTDGTDKVIAPIVDRDIRIKYECNLQNSGAAITRNNALRRAKGRWIAFLDSDDVWLPEKLERQLKFMVENDYAFTYHEYTEITEEGKELGVYVSGLRKVNALDMFACCWPGCLSVMYDAERIGLIQIKNVQKNNDTAMWLKVIKKTPCYLLKENLGCYRRRKGSITPPTLNKRIWAHYPLFRVAEDMNPINATFWTLANVVGNACKKIFYVKKYCPLSYDVHNVSCHMDK